MRPAGELAVRREACLDGAILWLSGELDRATATLLEHELDAAQVGNPIRRIVDLTGLVVIDPVGLSILAHAQQHARADGRPLRVRVGMSERRAARTGRGELSAQPVSRDRAVSDEDYCFALAMASD